MPITASASFKETVESVEYTRAASLTIYPPASDYLDFTSALSQVTLTAAMSSPLPDNAVIQTGTEATTLDVVLAGSFDVHDETLDAADFFNPDNPDSPLYHLEIRGCRVTFEWGAYVSGSADPELPGELIGWINGADFDWDARTVTLHVVDLDPDWAALPEIPAVVTASPYNAGLTSEFAMDALIRKVKGASTWPAQRPNCVLAAGLRSSLWPEVGTLDTTQPQPVMSFVPGAYGTGMQEVVIDVGWIGPTWKLDKTSNTLHIEFFVSGFDAPAATVNINLGHVIGGVFGSAGQILISPAGPSITDNSAYFFEWPTAIGSGPHYIAVDLAYSAGAMTGTFYLDGTSQSFSASTWAFALSSQTHLRALATGSNATIAGLQVTTEASPASNYGFTPQAVLDPSLNPLTVVPAITAGTQAWAELQTMAAAECGYIRRMPDGTIRFTNRINLLNQAVGRTISGDVSLTGLSTSLQPAAANHAVNVSYTEWSFGSAGLVWAATGKKKIPANTITTWTHEVTDGTLIANVDGVAGILANNATPGGGGNSTYRMALGPAGTNPHPGLRSLTILQLTSTTFQITADNRGGPTGYMVTPATYTDLDAGTPALWIGGILASQGDDATVTVSSGDGSNPLDFDSNNYLQDHDTAYAVGLFVLRQVRWDVREFTGVDILPDPRILCGDIDKLVESARSKVNDYVMVWGTTFNATFPPTGSDQQGNWSQTLDNARSLGPPDSWLGGAIPDRAEAGETWAY